MKRGIHFQCISGLDRLIFDSVRTSYAYIEIFIDLINQDLGS